MSDVKRADEVLEEAVQRECLEAAMEKLQLMRPRLQAPTSNLYDIGWQQFRKAMDSAFNSVVRVKNKHRNKGVYFMLEEAHICASALLAVSEGFSAADVHPQNGKSLTLLGFAHWMLVKQVRNGLEIAEDDGEESLGCSED